MGQKRVIVTGATDGIGLITARRLAEGGALVGLVARNPEKGERVVEDLKKTTGNPDIAFFKADLSKFDDVRAVADEIRAAHSALDVLVNNAGAMFVGKQMSADGFELTFALNHLSVFLLTNLLKDELVAAEQGRVVTVSSVAHRGADLNFSDLDGKTGSYSAWRAYQRSKLANILFTRELADRWRETHVTANCLHPGFVASKFGENNNPAFSAFFKVGKMFAISPEKGAETSVYLASADDVAGQTGGYYTRKKRVQPSRTAKNADTAKRLWEESLKMTGLEA
ncbi:SDR family oxidoreductase [Parvibaculaceae bacterium PLY_AMNH_Bact1]|nr:SDR family oxidoreductase [Parvibaculaceae bacterium PLY_AMNH_Bact1]